MSGIQKVAAVHTINFAIALIHRIVNHLNEHRLNNQVMSQAQSENETDESETGPEIVNPSSLPCCEVNFEIVFLGDTSLLTGKPFDNTF